MTDAVAMGTVVATCGYEGSPCVYSRRYRILWMLTRNGYLIFKR